MNGDNAIYFDIFGVEYIIGNRNITTNIYRIQVNDSTICGSFFIGFIDFMLKGKSLLDYTNLFSPSIYKKIYKIILDYFQ